MWKSKAILRDRRAGQKQLQCQVILARLASFSQLGIIHDPDIYINLIPRKRLNEHQGLYYSITVMQLE